MCKPLTKEQRDSIANNLGEPWWPGSMRGARMALTRMEHWLRQYEATVAALESQLAELRPLAEVGRAVEGMTLRLGSEHAIPESDERSGDPVVAWVSLTVQKGKDGTDYVWFYDEGNRQGDELLDAPRRGPTPLAALAAKGEGDE